MEINEYVRTIDGYIDQVKSINEKDMCGEYPRPSVSLSKCFINCFIDEITKHSKDIIDLIEVGDYVNGMEVEKIWVEPFGELAGMKCIKYKCEENARNFFIVKSILTHEQFEANAYILEKER